MNELLSSLYANPAFWLLLTLVLKEFKNTSKIKLKKYNAVMICCRAF